MSASDKPSGLNGQWLRPALSAVIAVLAGIAYGIVTRLAFGSSQFSDLLSTLSFGFLCLTPLALGVITVLLAPAHLRTSWRYAIFVPWIGCTLFMLLVAAFTWEAWICLVMALPIFLLMSTVGGVAACTAFVALSNQNQSGVMGLLALVVVAPYVVTPLERAFPVADSIRTVETQIEIFASPAIVWDNITRVRAISPEEHRFSWFHLAGLPRPHEATLSADGVGGVRRGQWEDGLAFVETITEWDAERSYTMQMEADASAVTNSTLPLRGIGGPAFDVVGGRYQLEVVGPEHVILHFTSTHRLSTRFNFYGGLWTDFFMADVQNYILDIVKARSEAR
jgi:hypothetical protein